MTDWLDILVNSNGIWTGFVSRTVFWNLGSFTEFGLVTKIWMLTCSSPRRPLLFHSLICTEKHLFIVGIGPIRDKEL